MEYHYDAFISYRHKELDAAAAKAVHRLIETYRIPAYIKKKTGKRTMGKVFRDQDELPLMSDLGEGIRTALNKSEWLIVICTPDLPLSRWCMAEVDHFIEIGRRDRILTLLVSGEPEESFPPQLRFVEDEDGKITEKEPLAADVRAKSKAEMLKKLRNEKLRLLAPVLGVGYDDLRRRQRERMMKTVAGVSAAAAVFFALFGGFSLYQASTISRQNIQLEERGRELKAERDNLLSIQSRNLAEHSLTQLGCRNVAGATLLALEALPKNTDEPERPLVPEAEMALRSAVMFDGWKDYRPVGSVLFPLSKYNFDLHIAPDGKTFAVTGDSSSMPVSYLYDMETLRLIGSVMGSPSRYTLYQTPSGFEVDINSALFTVDGSQLLLPVKGLYKMDTSLGSAVRCTALENARELKNYGIGRYRTYDGIIETAVRDVVEDREVLRIKNRGNCQSGYSPDGLHFVYTDSRQLLFVDLTNDETLADIQLTGEWMAVDGYLAVSPDNRYILRGGWKYVDLPGQSSQSREGYVQLFDVGSGEILWEYSASITSDESSLPNSGRTGLLFSPDGRSVLLPLWKEDSFQLYDLENRQTLFQSRRLSGRLSCLSFSSDGRVVLAVAGGSVTLLDAETGKTLQILSGFNANCAAFAQDDRYIIAKGESGSRAILIWERSREYSSRRIDSLHPDGLFIPGGRIVLYGYRKIGYGINYDEPSDESRMILCDAAGDALFSYPDSEYAENAFLSPEGDRIFASVRCESDDDSRVTRVWDVETGERLRDYSVVFHAISSDGKRLLHYDAGSSNDRHEYEIYDRDSGALLFTGSEPHAKRALVFDGALEKYICSMENELLISGTNGVPLLRLKDFPSKVDASGMWGLGSFSPDGRLVAVTDGHSPLTEVYDLTSCEQIAVLDAGESSARSPEWSPDGSGLLISSNTRTMCWLVNTEDWTTRFQLYDQPQSSHYGSFSPDGDVIYNDYYARDARTGELLIYYGDAIPFGYNYVSCSSDGRHFLLRQNVADSNRFLLRLFQMASLEELMEKAPDFIRERLLTAEERRLFGLQ